MPRVGALLSCAATYSPDTSAPILARGWERRDASENVFKLNDLTGGVRRPKS